MVSITKTLDAATFSAIVTDNWDKRRRWMLWTLIWMGSNVEAIIYYVIVKGSGGAIGAEILMTFLGAMVAILMFYIFGAVVDDHSKRRHFGLGLDQPADQPADQPDQTDNDDKG